MATEEDLYRIEAGFWLKGRKHFLENVYEKCLLAFPQMTEMHGVHSREEVASTATSSNRWRDLAMTDRALVENDDLAIISYRAEATRADDEPYTALVSSGYVRRSGGWRLIFHQHSPL
ncbi:hypothetical protein LH20_05210 [Sphingopyxis sp. 113P3]|nr:hypothetical protein LH20_05210 [Sphingopyxis sp. 113P3]